MTRWRDCKVLFIVGVCALLLLVPKTMTATTLADDDLWEKGFNNHGSIMLLIDAESGKILKANQAAATFYGYSVDQLQNMNIEQIHMYSPEEVEQERLAAASEERNHFIFPHRLASGEVRTVEVHSYPIDEEQSLLFSVINDITARQVAEKELLDRNSRLRRAEVLTGLGSWEIRLSDNQLFLSDGAERILGLVSGASLEDLDAVTVPEYREVRQQALQALIEENIPYDIELKFERLGDGAIIDVHSVGEYDPETNSVFGSLLDITEQRAAEKSLEVSRKREIYSLWTFFLFQLIAIFVPVTNILQRRKAQQELQQNLQRNESLVRILQHPSDSIQELLNYALSESIELTGSKLGYIYLYSEEKKEFTLNTWSGRGLEGCTVIDQQTVYQLDTTGIRGEAVRQRKPIIVNDFAALNPFQKGYPPGHVQLARSMTLPIFDQGKTVAVIGLANKQTDYDVMDTWQITLFMSGVWASLERKRSEMALREEKERLRTTLLSVGDGVIATDRHGRVEMINRVAQQLTGWSRDEALGQPFGRVFNIVNQYTKEKCEDPIQRVLSSEKPKSLANHTSLLSKEGEERPIAHSAAPIRAGDGQIVGAVLVFRDVTEEQRQLDEIKYLSYHDQLTGLYNRRFFEKKLQELDVAENLPLSLIIADLNNLKLVNDTFGHVAGDQFLQRTAEVLKRICPAKGIIARWGGDEFVLLFPKTTSQAAQAIMQKIEKSIREETVGSMSISIALGWSTKTESGEALSAVFKNAENHMYRTKLVQGSGIRAETIHTLMVALYETHRREEQHSKRVSALCQYLGKELGLSDQNVKELAIIGLFHDIGKIAIEEQILNKPSALTEDEWQEIMRHPEVGYRLLGAVQEMEDIASYVLAHHERWDGTGYPKGIQGEDIPLQSRIVAVADAYDAMVSERPYRKSMTKYEALNELKKNAGSQFDPHIVDVFVDVIDALGDVAVSY